MTLPPFEVAAVGNLIICLTLGYVTRSKLDAPPPKAFHGHLERYLVAWTLCIAGEWFGGPGVYALYSSYNFTPEQIAQLFVLGFACSSVLGCFAGNFADRFGRKRSAMLFCAIGVGAVTCKHFAYLPICFFGRILDGMHASLLYTAFESWLVSEHNVRHRFPGPLLGHSFALMFMVSYLVAILCGFVAQIGVSNLPPVMSFGLFRYGGWTFPFEMSALLQIIGGIYIALNWDENYGWNDHENDSITSNMGSPLSTLSTPRASLLRSCCEAKVLIAGLIVTCFESSMFIFVFSWTPALAPDGAKWKLPCGLIFATYMMACMSGASISRLCSSWKTAYVVFGVLVVSTATLAVPATLGLTEEAKYANFGAFVVFELCVGAYFPSIATLKSEYVPERNRTTIYNLFRTPMNAIVVAVLLCTPGIDTTFRLLSILLAVATVSLALFLIYDRKKPAKNGLKNGLKPLLGTPDEQ